MLLPVTVAVKLAVAPASTVAEAGVTDTVTVEAVIVSVTGEDVVPLATETAVTETVAGLGTLAGAV